MKYVQHEITLLFEVPIVLYCLKEELKILFAVPAQAGKILGRNSTICYLKLPSEIYSVILYVFKYLKFS